MIHTRIMSAPALVRVRVQEDSGKSPCFPGFQPARSSHRRSRRSCTSREVRRALLRPMSSLQDAACWSRHCSCGCRCDDEDILASFWITWQLPKSPEPHALTEVAFGLTADLTNGPTVQCPRCCNRPCRHTLTVLRSSGHGRNSPGWRSKLRALSGWCRLELAQSHSNQRSDEA